MKVKSDQSGTVIPFPRRKAAPKRTRRPNRAGSMKFVPGKGDEQGHYRVRVTTREGLRPWIDLPAGLTDRQAEELAVKRAKEARTLGYTPKRGPRAPPKVDVTTVASLIDPWLELVEDEDELAPATKEAHRNNVKRVRKALGPLRPDELTTGVVRRFIRSLRDEGLSPGRVRSIYGSLAQCIDAALAEEWLTLPANPVRHPACRAELPSVLPPDADEIRVMSLDAVSTFLWAPTTADEWRVRFLVLATSGMRDGEMCALRWANVHEIEGVLCYDVRRSLPVAGEEKTTKTRSSKRPIPVHRLAAEALAVWRLGQGGGDDAPVFPGPRGDLYRPAYAAEKLREYLEAAGLPTTFEGEPFRAHDLRACFSSWLASAGVDEETRGRLLGHAPRSMTSRHYTARDLTRLAHAVGSIKLAQKSSMQIANLSNTNGPDGLPMKEKVHKNPPGADSLSDSERESQKSIPHETGQIADAKSAEPGAGTVAGQLVDRALARALELAVDRGDLDACAAIVAEMRARRLGGGR